MIKEIYSVEAHSILKQSKNAVLIDVRSTMEHEYVGHPTNSIHVPIQEPPDWDIRADFIKNIALELGNRFPNIKDPHEIHVLLLCRSGKRSGRAASILESKGYRSIINIIDGFEGDKDVNHHRNVINGWRFNKLPWEQS